MLMTNTTGTKDPFLRGSLAILESKLSPVLTSEVMALKTWSRRSLLVQRFLFCWHYFLDHFGDSWLSAPFQTNLENLLEVFLDNRVLLSSSFLIWLLKIISNLTKLSDLTVWISIYSLAFTPWWFFFFPFFVGLRWVKSSWLILWV